MTMHVAGAFLRTAEWTWNHLPESSIQVRSVRASGRFLHALVCRWRRRRQYYGTLFLRNRPQLELIRRLADLEEGASTLTISVLGCSNGAEVYSLLATIRSARPDINVVMQAVDISHAVLQLARQGAYSCESPELVDAPIFERMTEAEMQTFFDRDGDRVKVRPWIREGIAWHVGDAGDPRLLTALGPQHIVVANNFLCHMTPSDAERRLRHIARAVEPGGYLIASGIDIGVRTRVATELGWTPVTDLLEDIHDGDPAVRHDWPWRYWGVEPLDKSREDWRVRYATTFQIGDASRR